MGHCGKVQKRKNPLGGGLVSGITTEGSYRQDGKVRYPHLSEPPNYFQSLSPIKINFVEDQHA